MDLAAREMQELWIADFADVPAGGIGNGALVCGLLPGVWDFTGHR
jgi:hypothetical protein